MKFDDWFETFEPEQEELCCYGVSDLVSAFNAGQKTAAKECAELVNQCAIKRHSARAACDIVRQRFGL